MQITKKFKEIPCSDLIDVALTKNKIVGLTD